MRLAASDCACVASGAAGGALLRYGISEWAKSKGSGPAAILVINVLGSFLLGGCTGALPGTRASLLIGTGFCGAFTTFSTYSVDAINFAKAGQLSTAAVYTVSTNVLSIGAAAAGLQLSAHPAVARLVTKLPLALKLPPKGPKFSLPPPPP